MHAWIEALFVKNVSVSVPMSMWSGETNAYSCPSVHVESLVIQPKHVWGAIDIMYLRENNLVIGFS